MLIIYIKLLYLKDICETLLLMPFRLVVMLDRLIVYGVIGLGSFKYICEYHHIILAI